jgi:hypothetical protein
VDATLGSLNAGKYKMPSAGERSQMISIALITIALRILALQYLFIAAYLNTKSLFTFDFQKYIEICLIFSQTSCDGIGYFEALLVSQRVTYSNLVAKSVCEPAGRGLLQPFPLGDPDFSSHSEI